MFRNCLASALRYLARNKLYTLISVVGLSLGLCTALLATLVIGNQLGQDHFIQGYENVYTVITTVTPPGQSTLYQPSTNSFTGRQLTLSFNEIRAATRLCEAAPAKLRHDAIEASELFYCADPNVFSVLALPAIAGSLRTALQQPDGVVLTRSVARKFFGRDAPLGETMLFDGKHALTVTAVLEDFPVNATHLRTGVFISSQAPWSELYRIDHIPENRPGSDISFGTGTYLRLAPHTSPQRLVSALPNFLHRLFAPPPKGFGIGLEVVRIDRLTAHPGLNPGFRSTLAMVFILGFGILFIAAINFVNLLTARSGQRAREVSIRKLAGAGRRELIIQFLGESIAYVLVAAVVATAMAEWLLPHTNAFLNSGATFSYWRDPAMMAAMVLTVLVLGALAGTWPALVLSALRPLRALKGGAAAARSAGLARQALVTVQFAILIGLMIASGIVYLQRQFATTDALRVDTDQVLLVRSSCSAGFIGRARALPSVRGSSCSSGSFLGSPMLMNAKDRTGSPQFLYEVTVGPSIFSLYGIKPLAGQIPANPRSPVYVINETAARRLGFSHPADALGFELPAMGRGASKAREAMLPVSGIVPDFSLGSVEHKIDPIGYVVANEDGDFNLISLKLTGRQLPEALAAIDAAWKDSGGDGPLNRTFLSELIQRQYIAILREAQLFAAFTAVAVLLSCLGLLGMAASIAERRTREIGIRKALGADTGQVLRLLLRQFSQPVVWANLLAWPITAWLMQRWLAGFAYHVDLPVWLFPLAAGIAVLVALLTVSTHSMLVARAKPVAALRYE